MEQVLLSTDEKLFLLKGIQENMRIDGRVRMQYRQYKVLRGRIKSSMGSSRVKLGGNELMVSVMGDLSDPDPNRPNVGFTEFSIDFSADALQCISKYYPETYADQLLAALYKTYEHMNMECFCVVPGLKCWKLNINILVLCIAGSLYDAVSFGIKTALKNLLIPKIKSIDMDGGRLFIKISEHELDALHPPIRDIPNIITIVKIGEHFVLDPTIEEEMCSIQTVILSVSPECCKVVYVYKDGAGCIHPITLKKLYQTAISISKKVEEANQKIGESLQKTSIS